MAGVMNDGGIGGPGEPAVGPIIDTQTEGLIVYSLQRVGEALEVLVDEKSLLRSDLRRNQGGLAELALAPWEDRTDVTVLLGGLGMGFTLRALLDRRCVSKVDVVEISPTIIDWNRNHFAELNGKALSDPRVTVHRAELGEFLREPAPDGQRRTGWFVIVLDMDEWPVSLARPENVDFYHDDGLLVVETALRPGGVMAMWTAKRDDELDQRLRARFQSVARVALPVETEAGVVYVYRGRRSGVGGGSG